MSVLKHVIPIKFPRNCRAFRLQERHHLFHYMPTSKVRVVELLYGIHLLWTAPLLKFPQTMGAVVAEARDPIRNGSGCGRRTIERNTGCSRKVVERRSVTVYW